MNELSLSRATSLDTVRRWVLTEQRLPGLFLSGYQSPVNYFEPSTLLKKFLTLATSKSGIQEATGENQWIDDPATVSYVTSQIHWGRHPLEDGTSLVSTPLHSVYRTEMVRPPQHGGTDR